MRLDVACAVDGPHYIPHSAAMLHSLVEHSAGHDLHVHYLHGPECPPVDMQTMETWLTRAGVDSDFLRIDDDQIAGLPVEGFGRKGTWYRTFLPGLRLDVDRMLYLDVDLIVTDSLAPLFEIDMTGQWVAAVTNVLQHDHTHRPAELGLPDHAYFNAGVLLMNLEQMRRDDCTGRLLEFARADPELLAWQDQDAINVVLGERRLPLHPRWNLMNAFHLFPYAADAFPPGQLEEAKAGPAIRHFEGPSVNKPWHYLCNRADRELYDRHRAQTPWPEVRREGVTPLNVVRRLLRVSA